MTPKEVARQMREMADVLETMPEGGCNWWVTALTWPHEADQLRAIAKAMGTFHKGDDVNNYEIERDFGDTVSMKASISRGKICRKVKVMKEVDEFVCDDSLLDPLTATESEVPA